MKKLLKHCAIALIAICAISTLSAKNEKQIVTRTFNTNIDCPSCEAKIMKVLPYMKGVKDVKVDLKRKSITIVYDAARNSDEAFVESLKRLDVVVLKNKKE